MSGDDDIADIDGVDPTPIHHPVDDEAIASAVQDATGDVVDEPAMDHDHSAEDATKNGKGGTDDDHDNHDKQEHESTSLLPDLRSSSKKVQKKRARRVGRVEVVRKVPKLSEYAAVQDVAAETQASSAPVEAPPAADATYEQTTTTATAPEGDAAAAPMAVDSLPRVLSKHDEKWNAMFQELLAFKTMYSHINVPQCYKGNQRLGRWVHYQRVEYWVFQETGGGKITPERVARLEAIGFEWDPQKAQWNAMFKKLQKYAEEMGHCRVPKGYTQDPEMANWVRNQRLEHANKLKGKKSRMTDDRFKLLDDLGFRWSGHSGKNRVAKTADGTSGDSKPDSAENMKAEDTPKEATAEFTTEESKTDDSSKVKEDPPPELPVEAVAV